MLFSKSRIFSWFLLMMGVATSGAAPAIIPLPVQLQTRPGIFTLCPTQQVAGAVGHAMVKILADSSSFSSGQYLAAILRKSTGYEFAVVTNSSAGPVRASILLTTVNGLPRPRGRRLRTDNRPRFGGHPGAGCGGSFLWSAIAAAIVPA